MATFFQKFEAGLSGLGRRLETRYEATGQAMVYELGPKRVLIGEASLRNISASGACITMQTRLMPGARVHLAGPSLGIDAIVRHSAAGTTGFVMGLEVIDSLRSEDSNQTGLPAAW